MTNTISRTSLPKYARDTDRPYEGNPWDRQPRESTKAFECFLLYLELPADDRTITGAIRIYNERNGLSPRGTPTWPQKHRWIERAEAFDNYIAAKKIAQLKRKKVAAAERHAEQAADALEVFSAPSRKLAARLREQLANRGMDFLDDLEDADLLKLARAFSGDMPALQKAERDAYGAVEGSTVAPQQLKARGEMLRRLIADPTMVSMVERLTVEVSQSQLEGQTEE